MTTITDIRIAGSGPVVVVDDDEIDREILGRAHARSSVENEFLPFPDGASFLSYVEGAVEAGTLPSIVLLDIDMPIMNGFEVMEAMRANSALQDVPVALFYSNSDSPLDRDRAENLGTRLQEKSSSIRDCIAFLDSLLPE